MNREDPSKRHTGPINTRLNVRCFEIGPVERESGNRQLVTPMTIARFPMKLTSAREPSLMELNKITKSTLRNTCYNKFELGDRFRAFVPKVGSCVKIEGDMGYGHEMATVLQVNRSTVKVALVEPGSCSSTDFSVDFFSITGGICNSR